MVLSIRRWTSRLAFCLIFMILLLAATGGFRWLADVISPVRPYEVPEGDALKVNVQEPMMPDSSRAAERLRWFYWYGE